MLTLTLCVSLQARALTTGYLYLHYDNCTPSSIISYSVDGGSWQSVYAGVYNLHIQAEPGRYGDFTDAKEVSTLIDGLGGSAFQHTTAGGAKDIAVSAPTFCIDINQLAPKNNEWNFYELRTLDAAPGGAPGTLTMTDQSMTDLTKLWYYYSGLLDQGTVAERNFLAGVFQVCVWEIVNERDGNYDLSDGHFKIANSNFFATGNTWLNSLADLADAPEEYQLRALYSDLYQDFAVLMPVTLPGGGTGAIPEPMTMASLGMAIAGVGAYMRKRKIAVESR